MSSKLLSSLSMELDSFRSNCPCCEVVIQVVLKMESRVSNDQIEMLLDHLYHHTALAKGFGLGGRSKETSEKLWNELATNLNALGSGTNKTGAQWKRYWINLKHKAKSKAAALRREQSATGGGPRHQKPLSDTYKKVLAIIGEEAACGDVQFRVPVFDIVASSPPPLRRQLFPPTKAEIEPCYEAGLLPTPQQRIFNKEMPSPSTSGQTSIMLESRVGQARQLPEPEENQVIYIQPDSPQTQPMPKSSLSRNRTRTNLRTRTDNSWVIDLERRRVAAEEKLSEAVKVIAEAAKIKAEVSKLMRKLLN